MKKTSTIKIGKNIQEIRKSNGYTQEKLAEAIEVSVRHISDIEQDRAKPSYEILIKICNILNIGINQIFSKYLNKTENKTLEYSIAGFDKLKTKVLKYILFKKRTEQEVRQKFREDSGEMLDDVIEELKELNYINDENYIQRAVNEFKNLKNMSIKEIQYKLMTKGLKKDIIDNYICNNKEELLEYEIQSAKNIAIKKQNSLEREEIIAYLAKKGYLSETIKIALEE